MGEIQDIQKALQNLSIENKYLSSRTRKNRKKFQKSH